MRSFLNYAQVIGAVAVLVVIRGLGLNVTILNNLGLLIAIVITYSIILGFLNRFSDDWAGFSGIAILIYILLALLKMKFFLVGLPVTLAMVVVFYLLSGMNLDRMNSKGKVEEIDKTEKTEKK